jgi:hypothetical protein
MRIGIGSLEVPSCTAHSAHCSVLAVLVGGMEPPSRKRSGLSRNDRRKAKALRKASQSDETPGGHTAAWEGGDLGFALQCSGFPGIRECWEIKHTAQNNQKWSARPCPVHRSRAQFTFTVPAELCRPYTSRTRMRVCAARPDKQEMHGRLRSQAPALGSSGTGRRHPDYRSHPWGSARGPRRSSVSRLVSGKGSRLFAPAPSGGVAQSLPAVAVLMRHRDTATIRVAPEGLSELEPVWLDPVLAKRSRPSGCTVESGDVIPALPHPERGGSLYLIKRSSTCRERDSRNSDVDEASIHYSQSRSSLPTAVYIVPIEFDPPQPSN